MSSAPITAVLVVHAVAGFVAMLGGLVPALTRKGGAGHRRWGRVFTWAMVVVAASTVPLAVVRLDPFQAALGLLAGYAALLGKRTGSPTPPTSRDAIASALCGFTFFCLIAGSLFWSFGGDGATARLAFAFGAMGVGLAVRDLAGFLLDDQGADRRIVDHILATTLALCVAWGSFLNTQLFRLTGARWPIDAKLGLPFVVVVPVLLLWAPRWGRRLREQGARAWAGGREPLEMERLHAFGIAEGTSLLLLLFVAIPARRYAGEPALVRLIGPVHGALFVLYVICAAIAARAHHWTWRRTALTVLAAMVPFGAFVVNRETPGRMMAKLWPR